jgi:hypothetical protein
MIVWSGKGFLSVLVLIGALIISIWLLPDSLSDYGFVIACFVSAGFSWIFGKKWNTQNERIVTDDKTGQKLRIINNHTLFWIPMHYWGIIFSLSGIIILFQNSIPFSIVASILVAGLVVFELIRNKPKVAKLEIAPSNLGFNSKKAKRKELEEVEERLKQQAEEEAERINRRKEKEDPSRFMPR